MTPEDLERAIPVGPGACVGALRGAGEAERRKAAPVALRWHKALRKASWGQSVLGAPFETVGSSAPLALLGTGSLSEIRQERCTGTQDQELTLRVLRDRRPDWLADWAEWVLERVPLWWPLIRRMQREGLIGRLSGEAYYLGMITGLRPRGVLEMLREDRELLGEVWKLFEVEGSGEHSLAAFDKYHHADSSWSHALVELSRDGTFSRDRLLDASLEALGRDFEQFRAGWFSRFHEALEPTAEERQARLEAYLGLLGSRIRPTVSFALKALKDAEPLPADRLLGAVGPALTSRDKGTAVSALRLVEGAVRREPERHADAAAVVAEGLGHASPEVQKKALELVRKWALDPDALLQGRLDGLAASVRPGPRPVAAEPAPPAPAAAEAPPVTPIGSVEELLDVYLGVLENAGPPEDIERVLDGVSRFADQPPDSRRAGPLVKRARQKIFVSAQAWTGGVVHDLSALALAWQERQLEPLPEWKQPDLSAFLGLRVAEVAAHAYRREAAPLLALPTRSGGWLDAGELERRLASHPEPGRLDKLQASLRAGLEATSPSWSLRVESRPYLYRGRTHYHQTIHVDVEFGELSADKPRTLLWVQPTGGLPERRWQATVCPGHREPWWVTGLFTIANNLDWHTADWAARVYLETLLDPQVPLDRAGRLLLAFGLAAKEPAQAGLSVDGLARAVTDGRLDADGLAAALIEVNGMWNVKAGRWARTLGTAARISPVHGHVVHATLARLLAHNQDAALLELAVELGAELALGIEDPGARERLAGLKRGKAGKLAGQLLA
ncbi:MAG: hypothetical protein HY319_00825 [Armatimonadetes bacterium]|nr:hypothetical protein [Armatimonadota bacterium]